MMFFRSKNVFFYRLCFSWQIMHCFCFWQKNVFWQIVLCLRQMIVSKQMILFEKNQNQSSDRTQQIWGGLQRPRKRPRLERHENQPFDIFPSFSEEVSFIVIFLLLVIDLLIIIISSVLVGPIWMFRREPSPITTRGPHGWQRSVTPGPLSVRWKSISICFDFYNGNYILAVERWRSICILIWIFYLSFKNGNFISILERPPVVPTKPLPFPNTNLPSTKNLTLYIRWIV